jgi:integrase
LIVAPQPAPAVNVELQDDGTLNFLGTPVDPAVFGPWLRELILTRKKWVAELTRIENLAHLEDVVAPPASATLVEVGTLYETFADISVDWKRKARSAWSEFCDVVAAPTLRDMTQADVMRYGDFVTGQGKPTSARNKYQAVKAILGLPAKRGQWAEDTARALALCKVLSLPTRAGTDPKPIAPAVFTALLAKADTRTRAVLLLALNCCMYASEVAAMKWSDLDLVNGTLVAKRPKTGVVRIATLWPATVEAVKAIPRITDHVFVSVHGTTLTAKVLSDDFRELRILAKQPDAQFAQIRDGSYTVVCEAGISLDVCRLLAGHKQGGQTDAYVKRSPRMVKPACDAIAAAYGITVVKGSPCWS